jgi:cytochrome c biogenesis protein CcmG/thiol:disulfide interchange protein DsbE
MDIAKPYRRAGLVERGHLSCMAFALPRWPLKRPTIWTILFAGLWIFILVRFAPHIGAIVGVRSGGEIAPTYSVTTLDGAVVSSADLRGKVVLVNFWATWCLPCRAEMPLLEGMWKRHAADGFVLLGFSTDRSGVDGVRQFVGERSISYPVAIVGPDVEAAFGGVRGIPTSFLIDREGLVRHRVVGPLAPATLELAVRRLLGGD